MMWLVAAPKVMGEFVAAMLATSAAMLATS
jgi:hypothetical protein